MFHEAFLGLDDAVSDGIVAKNDNQVLDAYGHLMVIAAHDVSGVSYWLLPTTPTVLQGPVLRSARVVPASVLTEILDDEQLGVLAGGMYTGWPDRVLGAGIPFRGAEIMAWISDVMMMERPCENIISRFHVHSMMTADPPSFRWINALSSSTIYGAYPWSVDQLMPSIDCSLPDAVATTSGSAGGDEVYPFVNGAGESMQRHRLDGADKEILRGGVHRRDVHTRSVRFWLRRMACHVRPFGDMMELILPATDLVDESVLSILHIFPYGVLHVPAGTWVWLDEIRSKQNALLMEMLRSFYQFELAHVVTRGSPLHPMTRRFDVDGMPTPRSEAMFTLDEVSGWGRGGWFFSPEEARGNLGRFVGGLGLLADLEPLLDRACITGSSFMAATMRQIPDAFYSSCRMGGYGRYLADCFPSGARVRVDKDASVSVGDQNLKYQEAVMQSPSVVINDPRSAHACGSPNNAFIKFPGIGGGPSGHAFDATLHGGSDVDICVECDTYEELDEIARRIFAVVASHYPKLYVLRKVCSKTKHRWSIEPHTCMSRVFEIYRSSIRGVFGHHLGFVRGGYTAYWNSGPGRGPEFFMGSSAVYSAIGLVTPNYMCTFSEKRTPSELFETYMNRGGFIESSIYKFSPNIAWKRRFRPVPQIRRIMDGGIHSPHGSFVEAWRIAGIGVALYLMIGSDPSTSYVDDIDGWKESLICVEISYSSILVLTSMIVGKLAEIRRGIGEAGTSVLSPNIATDAAWWRER